MRVNVIESSQSFAQVRGDWEAVYDADPEAQFFLSWTWLSGWLGSLGTPWFVLAARPNETAPYAAFLPLRLRTKVKKGVGFFNEVIMGGSYAADYTGLICRPDDENEAIPALARHLRQLNWAEWTIENICASDQRLRLLLAGFRPEMFNRAFGKRVNKLDNVDNCICPYASLPGSWESYLERLSANTRQKTRRFLRNIESSDELSITLATADTIDRDIDILFRFWTQKWGQRKGARLRSILQNNSQMLRRAAEAGSLFLPVLWKGQAPLGALASLIDPRKRSLLFYMGARDEAFNNPPPGFVLHAYSIRYAIENGFVTYDFLRGNEPYKYSFATDERRIKCVLVSTKNGRNIGDRLDRRSLPVVLQRSTELYRAGDHADAERGFRQILEVVARHAEALYCLGQVLSARRNHADAVKTFRTLVAVKPNSYKAWLRLADALHARRAFKDAAAAYREAIKRGPERPDAHHKLGLALLKLGQFNEALASLQDAIRLKPDFHEAKLSLGNALFTAEKLAPEKWEQFALLNVKFGDHARSNGADALAIQSYKQAIAMKPDLVRAHLGLAQVFEAQGHADNAAQSYRKVRELQSGSPDAGVLSEVPAAAKRRRARALHDSPVRRVVPA
jgi:tetratricopeptide (TPR) repeat protein